MNDTDNPRRLSAILAADVAGYTRLMEQDSEGTVEAWKTARSIVVEPAVAEYSGRVVKLTGDGFLAEFHTVQDAVKCAVAMQEGLASNPLDFRMGVNLGDIIDDGVDIHGEGVNIAARIEALAEPGGISISGSVYDQVRNRINLDYEDFGEHVVKHVTAPVQVFKVSVRNDDEEQINHAETPRKLNQDEKPSIAVLPFDNMSGDTEQEYFVDGMTEDIITELSRNRWMTVIARNTTFTYKGRAVNVSDVARELDVLYVIEGSVRKSGERVRINVQLIDGTSGNHIWAERFDRQNVDVFDLQDEITRKIAAAVEPEIFAAEGHNASQRNPAQLSSWNAVMMARTEFWKLNQKSFEKAIQLMSKVVDDYPKYSFASSALAFMHLVSVHMGWSELSFGLETAERLAKSAAQLDEQDPWAHISLGYLQFMNRKTAASLREYSHALELNPNSATAYGYRALTHGFAGNFDEAISDADHAIRLSPRDPQMHYFLGAKACANFTVGQYEQAVEIMGHVIQSRPDFPGAYRLKVSALAHLGEMEEAKEVMSILKKLQPLINIAGLEATIPYPDEESLGRFISGLKMAGLD